MRLNRLPLAPLTALIALGVATPSLAADAGIDVADYEFTPSQQRIAVGDSVTWNFRNDGHTSTAERGQAEVWNSKTKAAGTTYTKRFTRPGRFQYICTPHVSFDMEGVILVGQDAERDTVDAFRTRASGTRATVSFRLNEPAQIAYRLTGPRTRTGKPQRFKAGNRSFALKGLRAGRYRVAVTFVDDFDKRVVQRKSFRIR